MILSIWAKRACSSNWCRSVCAAKLPSFDIAGKDGTVIVPKDKRITAKHIREMEAAGIKKVAVPDEFLLGRVLAHDVVDKETGEIVANANDEITEELLAKLQAAGVAKINTLYTNDLDQGALYFADPAYG